MRTLLLCLFVSAATVGGMKVYDRKDELIGGVRSYIYAHFAEQQYAPPQRVVRYGRAPRYWQPQQYAPQRPYNSRAPNDDSDIAGY